MCDKAVELMAEGWSKACVAAELGISRDTLHRWINEHKKFSDAITRGEELQQAWWEKTGRQGMMGEIEGFQSGPFVWMTKNILKWRDKQEISGEDGGALQINIIQHGAGKQKQDD